MIPLNANPNVDNSDLVNYPNGRIKDNTGTGNGTPINRNVYGDLHSTISKLMRLYGIVPNGLPDNETNSFQIIEAISALASKNDYIYPLLTNGVDELSVDVKLSLMKENEFLMCLAAVNKTTETIIKGSNGTSFAVTYSGNFKANEYVRVIKTVSGISIIRVADWNSLSAMAIDLGFLKKASQAQEDAGASDAVATTPLVNKTTFQKRVNGDDSDIYLASETRNGVYPKEHYEIVANLTNAVRNKGTFSGLNVGTTTGTLTYDGDISLISCASQSAETYVTVTVDNAMDNTNYLVKSYIQGLNADGALDSGVCYPSFRIISVTKFELGFRETKSTNQLLKIHIEVQQL